MTSVRHCRRKFQSDSGAAVVFFLSSFADFSKTNALSHRFAALICLERQIFRVILHISVICKYESLCTY